MAARKATPKSTKGVKDLVPGAMSEAMVKGALVDESDMDYGEVAQMGWGFAIKSLIAVRGGNYTYNEVYESEAPPVKVKDTSTTSPALVAEAEEEDEDDFDSLMAALDDDEADDFQELVPSPAVAAAIERADAAIERADAALEIADLMDDLDNEVPTAEEAGQALFIGMPTTRDYIFDGHAGAGPSGAERWMVCTASLGASRAFLETLTTNQRVEFAKAGMAARQGTTAHAVGESEARLMLGEITEEEHENTMLDLAIAPPDGEEYDDEMAEYVTEYSDLVKQYHQSGHEVLIEARVKVTVELMTVDRNGDHDIHVIEGSADFAALPPVKAKKGQRVLTVGDLKYGKGKEVEADDNPQTKTYALGVIELLVERGYDIWSIDRVDLIIIQPRLGGIKVWSTTVDDLLEWRDDVLSPALTEALAGRKGGAKFVPGEVQCQWCPARGGCAALAEARMDAAADLFDVIIESEFEGEEFPEVTLLPNDRLGNLLKQAEGLTKIKDDLKAEVQRRLHRGGSVPGYQLVSYTPSSKWKPEAQEKLDPEAGEVDILPEAVIEKLWQRKLLSPTQTLKVLGKGNEGAVKAIEELIDRPDKRPIVAPEKDRRKTWEGKPPESMFEDETTADVASMFKDES